MIPLSTSLIISSGVQIQLIDLPVSHYYCGKMGKFMIGPAVTCHLKSHSEIGIENRN